MTESKSRMSTSSESSIIEAGAARLVKCVVWDLDNTFWDGVLLEGDQVRARDDVLAVIRELDARGILQSIASKNDYAAAMAKLQEMGLDEYFLYPQINWNAKASSIKAIAEAINIGLDAIAFIDDQAFELEEVRFSHPEVLCIHAGAVGDLLAMPEMNPRFITEDSKKRRAMYLSDIQRKRNEEEFIGAKEDFLASLDMTLTLSSATVEDLRRAEELTLRTNQLNTTGYTYSYDELDHFRQSAHHRLLIAGLDDRFGSYGKIGLALIECQPNLWNIKLLLMSCRVMSRGVGSAMLSYILGEAFKHQALVRAEFVPNGKNRMMYVTYKFAGFKEVEKVGDFTILENNLRQAPPFPAYLEVKRLD